MPLETPTASAPRSRITEWLDRASPAAFSTYCIVAAFTTYFCMYAFRKPFTAAEFADITLLGLSYKAVLVAAQVAGYTLSKFIGVKVIAEMPAGRRAAAILVLIGIAEVALLGFAIVPPPYNFPMLFLNGLPLGMVFGLVVSFLEGRRLTEVLSAGLCASFIVSSGAVKSIGRWMLVEVGVGEFWMPFIVGAIFVAPLVLAVWMLSQTPPPSAADVQHRTERVPMDRAHRVAFFRRHAFVLTGLVAIFVALTVLRSLRDDFAVEIWRDLGHSGAPSVFAISEMWVMFGVIVINGGAAWIKPNRSAMVFSLVLVLFGLVLVLLSLMGRTAGVLDPFAFMVLIGLGAYIPYVAFHTTVFERLIALYGERANLGFLICVADAAGYLSYVVVMFAKPLLVSQESYLSLFILLSSWIASIFIGVTTLLLVYYARPLPAFALLSGRE